ncbi:hypothetical protein DIPPA_29524 [Diplonema papillatum]|nr:hypothetical protein DIPPA_29524 [Diplonema papillatum]|eukprot:gene22622-34620_t
MPLKKYEVKSAGDFTKGLWDRAASVVGAIEEHPFLKKMLDGTLPISCFQFYIKQDALYLADFSRGLALLGARAPPEFTERTVTLLGFAKEAITVEAKMHGTWLKEWSSTDPEELKFTASSATTLYTSYILNKAATDTWEVACAAFLPCFWVYYHVGKFMYAYTEEHGQSPDPHYQKWINQYAGDEFEASVLKMMDIVESAGASANPQVKKRMEEAFVLGCKMEWMFWQAGHDKSFWPV